MILWVACADLFRDVRYVDCRDLPPRYNRDKLRYPSDLPDAEWAYIEPMIPPAKRPRE